MLNNSFQAIAVILAGSLFFYTVPGYPSNDRAGLPIHEFKSLPMVFTVEAFALRATQHQRRQGAFIYIQNYAKTIRGWWHSDARKAASAVPFAFGVLAVANAAIRLFPQRPASFYAGALVLTLVLDQGS